MGGLERDVRTWDFPGGPVAKTPHSQGSSLKFYPWSAKYFPHAATKTRPSQINIKKKTTTTKGCQNLGRGGRLSCGWLPNAGYRAWGEWGHPCEVAGCCEVSELHEGLSHRQRRRPSRVYPVGVQNCCGPVVLCVFSFSFFWLRMFFTVFSLPWVTSGCVWEDDLTF